MSAQDSAFEVEEKELEPLLVAGIRYKGRYDEIGEKLGLIARAMGRNMDGKPMNLYFDDEFKESGADIETCIPVREGLDTGEIKIHTLPGGRAVALIHKGPYSTLNESYEKISNYIGERGLKVKLPCREVYVKGPGMIFRGNPGNYLTEIQMLIEE